MAAPYTDSATLTALVTAAYDRQVRLSLRSVPMFRSIATVKVVEQTAPGNSVAFLIHGDLAPATGTLSDNGIVDPTGAALSNPTSVTVTLNEYGNYTVVSKALREFALDNNLDGNIANVIAYNLAQSVDQVIENVLIGTDNNITSQTLAAGTYRKPVVRTYAELLALGTGTSASSSTTTITVADTKNLKVGMTFSVVAGTGVLAAGTAGNTIATIASGTTFTVATAPTTALSGATLNFSNAGYFLENDGASTGGATNLLGTLSAKDVRWVVAQLRANNVPTIDGQNYVAFIHPTVAADFRAETSSNAASAIWAAPHSFIDGSNMYAGEIGTFEGVRFIETPRVPAIGNSISAVKNGTAQTAVVQNCYTTFIVGADALAEAVAEEFHIVADGVVVDPLKRKMALGWYGIAGWNLFRSASMYAVKSTTANG